MFNSNKLQTVLNSKVFKTIILIMIVIYPLRWSFTGLDMWDTGYNCVNAKWFDIGSMSDSWFFSTYLSTAAGHLISKLPFGDTLAGYRLLCGLVISADAMLAYLFCIKRLKLNRFCTAAGELLAISLCYNPSVVLYNHLSFLILNMALMLLYTGLTGKRRMPLYASGALIGLNVFVRFSNIPQAMLILAVWYYLYINKEKAARYVEITGLCLLGYIFAAASVLAVIGYKYGIGSYLDGIRGLFGMTEEATDYTPLAMIMHMFDSYIRGFRRIVDIVIFAGLAFVLSVMICSVIRSGNSKVKYNKILIPVSVITGASLVAFLVSKQLMQFSFHHYITVILTAAMFIDIALMLCGSEILNKNDKTENRLMAALTVCYIAVLSVGSNTAISPVMNSMFIIAPYTITKLVGMTKRFPVELSGRVVWHEQGRNFRELLYYTGGIVTATALLAFYIQCCMFGARYCYQEAQNGAGGDCSVIGNRVLMGTVMSEERAGSIQGLYDHVRDRVSSDRGVIIYGYTPSLAYYLDLKPVITPWPDLDSYNTAEMKRDMAALEEKAGKGYTSYPLIIIDSYNSEEQKEHNPEKWETIHTFMKKYHYTIGYDDGRYVVYEY